ncbi:MAG: HD domain-containing protein [Lentisphaeria bacterium]|nr:HD domain-containing protein [Lentisphaeria bacterium]
MWNDVIAMREPYASLFPRLRIQARRALSAHPECHGWDHTLRVWRNTVEILMSEQADTAVAQYAAVLHDVGRAAEFADNGESCHAEVGAAMVPDLLAEVGVTDPAFIDHVAECVRTHRFRARSGRRPASLEAKIVYDADKLDSMGAVGVGRAFHFAGRVGARVHNTKAEALAAESYSLEDSAYREYLVKLSAIQDKLLTPAGRRLGRRRHEFMAAFFDELIAETGVA